MLKILAIFAVLSAFLFGWPCVAQKHLGQPQTTAEGSENHQHPVAPSSLIVNPSFATPCSQYKPCYIQESSPEKPLPRFIRPEWVIVYITTIYVVLAWQTLRVISSQSRSMEIQAETAKLQAVLMNRQMESSIERERAKLRIELDPLQPVPASENGGCYLVTGSVSIYGLTEAFIEMTEIYASIGEDGINHPLPEWSWGMHLSPVIRPGSPAAKISTIINTKDGPASDEEMLSVREAKAFVYCAAKIEFQSHGERWVVRLRQRFKPIWGVKSLGFIGSWEPDGMAWENEENRQPPKPELYRPTDAN